MGVVNLKIMETKEKNLREFSNKFKIEMKDLVQNSLENVERNFKIVEK